MKQIRPKINWFKVLKIEKKKQTTINLENIITCIYFKIIHYVKSCTSTFTAFILRWKKLLICLPVSGSKNMVIFRKNKT